VPQSAGAVRAYRNVVFTDDENFVSNDRFYNERDGRISTCSAGRQDRQERRPIFYFTNAMHEMERHFRATRAPMFTLIQTMSGIGPMDYAYMTEVDRARRRTPAPIRDERIYAPVAMAKMDFAFWRASCAALPARALPDRCTTAIITRWRRARWLGFNSETGRRGSGN